MMSALQVRELLHKRIRDSYLHPQFNTDVMKPLSIEALMDQQVCWGLPMELAKQGFHISGIRQSLFQKRKARLQS